MRHVLDRARSALFSSLVLLACDDPLRLVVVEANGGQATVAGSNAVAGVGAGSSGGGAGSVGSGGAGSSGRAGDASAGTAEPSGGDAAGGDGGMAGMAGMGTWDSPALFTASFSSHARPGEYMRHTQDKGFVTVIETGSVVEKQDATFDVIPGLFDTNCISLRAVNLNGGFFRHAGSRIYLHPAVDEPLFFSDATFCLEPGLADPQGVSFRSTNFANRFIHLRNENELWIDDIVVDDAQFASESTFYRETPLTDYE